MVKKLISEAEVLEGGGEAVDVITEDVTEGEGSFGFELVFLGEFFLFSGFAGWATDDDATIAGEVLRFIVDDMEHIPGFGTGCT